MGSSHPSSRCVVGALEAARAKGSVRMLSLEVSAQAQSPLFGKSAGSLALGLSSSSIPEGSVAIWTRGQQRIISQMGAFRQNQAMMLKMRSPGKDFYTMVCVGRKDYFALKDLDSRARLARVLSQLCHQLCHGCETCAVTQYPLRSLQAPW